MNIQRGLFRPWVLAAAVWILATSFAFWPLAVPSEGWPPDTSFCAPQPYDLPFRRPPALCEQGYRDSVLKEWEHFGMQTAIIILPPFLVLFAVIWVWRGLRAD